MNVDKLRVLLEAAPAGTLFTREGLLEALDDEGGSIEPQPTPEGFESTSWRSRLWTEPPERRIGVEEVAEAFGVSMSWVYKHTGPAARDPVPCRKFGGSLVFLVGELRGWLETHEEVLHGPRLRAVG